MSRRYLPTLFVLFVLLVAGGSAIYVSQDRLSTSGLPALLAKLRGYYVPTFTQDVEGQTMSLIFVGSVVGTLVMTLGLGIGLAFGFNWFTRTPVASAPARPAPAAPKPAAERATKSGEAPSVFLSDQRSLTTFWVLLVVLGAAFMIIRYWGKPIGTLPSLSEMASMKVFRLPGEHIEGLPSFIAGPGDDVTGLQLAIGVLVGTIVGTAVTGVVLARLFAVLDEKIKAGDKLPQTVLDTMTSDLIATAQGRRPLGALLPAGGLDRAFLFVNGFLALIVVVLVGGWVISNQGAPAAGGGELGTLQEAFAALPAGNTEAGQSVFAAKGCSGCHSLEAGVRLVGPSLKGAVDQVNTRRPGYPPEVYFYESITRPSAFVVPGFQDGLMPKNFAETLAPRELADVIAFVMAQK